jgi:hypothetical protein
MGTFPKIIGIGLPKTGTTSLATALQVLGCEHVTHRPDLLLQRYRRSGRWDMGRSGAVMDINPWPLYAIRRAYPDALLVHTHRDIDSWLASCEVHFSRDPEYNPEGRLEIFGVTRYVAEVFADTHKQHGGFVRHFFNTDTGPHINLEAKQGWEPLCKALRVPVPEIPYPHENKRKQIPWEPTKSG